MAAKAHWRCFHCNSTFPNTAPGRKAAAEHFGATDDAPVCKVVEWHKPIAMYVRELQDQLARYHAEDNDTLRALCTFAVEQAEKLRSAEEAGYGKAVTDMKRLLIPEAMHEETWDRIINGRETSKEGDDGACDGRHDGQAPP